MLTNPIPLSLQSLFLSPRLLFREDLEGLGLLDFLADALELLQEDVLVLLVLDGFLHGAVQVLHQVLVAHLHFTELVLQLEGSALEGGVFVQLNLDFVF